MNSSDRPKRFISVKTRWCAIACATAILAAAMARPTSAGCPCGKRWPHLICHHGASHATGPGDIVNADTGGTWYWVRSPEQERRVVMNLYNRYCIRCHGVDGRGVWDIPDVPDFTNQVWQTTRPDDYRSRVILEGRGAVMPAFRGTLTLEEACAMARYLHSFTPGTEVSRPDLGTSATPPLGILPGTVTPMAPIPAPAPSTPGPFNR
jgi:mono/diheme cytochrome c family protein